MQALKDPALIISVIDLLWSFSITLYGYRKFLTTDTEIENLKKIILQAGQQIGNQGVLMSQLKDKLDVIDTTVSGKMQSLTTVPGRLNNLEDNIWDTQDLLQAVIEALKAKDIQVVLPKPVPEPEPLFKSRTLKAPAKPVRRQLAAPPVRGRNVRFQEEEDLPEEDDLDSEVETYQTRRR